MLNAVDAYKLSIKAEKQEIERRIVDSAKNGKFGTEISKIYFEYIEDIVDELKANGYEVTVNGNAYIIKWNHAASAFNQ